MKIPDFVASKLKNKRAPILVRPLARVGVLEQRGAIKLRQRPGIAWEVGGHPIHDHADTGPCGSFTRYWKSSGVRRLVGRRIR